MEGFAVGEFSVFSVALAAQLMAILPRAALRIAISSMLQRDTWDKCRRRNKLRLFTTANTVYQPS
jgi:hypothetical protein